MQRLVSTFQKWWFRPQQQRPSKNSKKIVRCRIAGIARRRFNSNPKTIGQSIGSWPGKYFQTLTCHWKDPKRRKMGAVRIKRNIERRNNTCKILFDRFKRKVIFASHCYWRWKVDLFRHSQAQKTMAGPRLTMNFTNSMQYS